MGRKIPGKKHRQTKDPYKQRQKRLDSLRSVVNNPPSNIDEQKIPKSLLKIMELKSKAKKMKPQKRRRRKKKPVLLSVAKLLDKDPDHKKMTKPDKYIPNLIQKPNESATHFLQRVSSMTQDLINEVEFERKLGVEIEKNPETGEVIQLKKKRIKSKKKKLSEKRKEKRESIKECLNQAKDFSQLKDKVEFGEVVHGPPSLPPVKKKDTKERLIKNQKIRFGSLLLSSAVEKKRTKSTVSAHRLEKEKSEKERKFIVEAYRKLKKKDL